MAYSPPPQPLNIITIIMLSIIFSQKSYDVSLIDAYEYLVLMFPLFFRSKKTRERPHKMSLEIGGNLLFWDRQYWTRTESKRQHKLIFQVLASRGEYLWFCTLYCYIFYKHAPSPQKNMIRADMSLISRNLNEFLPLNMWSFITPLLTHFAPVLKPFYRIER